MHTHHLLPQHIIVWEDSINKVELTVEQHAEHHRCLWNTFNYYEDYIAWKALTGQISGEEAIKEAQRLSGYRSKGRKITFSEHHKQNMRKPKVNTKNMFGPKSEEHRNNMKGRCGIHNRGRPSWHKGRKIVKVKCPHCSTIGGGGSMKRWHFDNCKNRSIQWQ